MPSSRARGNARPRGHHSNPNRASMSLNEQEVESMLSLFARLDVAPASIRSGIGANINKVRAKLISMRDSIRAAQIAKHALEGQAAQ